MTKQDDASLNTSNPLYLRSPSNGGSQRTGYSLNPDQNNLNLTREAGDWSAGRVPYLKNETVWHQGGRYIALIDNSVEPTDGNNTQWQLIGGSGGHGGMTLDTPTAGSIGLGWDPVPFDNNDIVGFGCTLDTANNQFSFTWPTVWLMSFFMNVSHNESNGSREFDVRLFDITGAVAGSPLPLYVARNQSGTVFSTTFLIAIAATDLGNLFRIEIGGTTDTFSAVTYEQNSIDLVQVSTVAAVAPLGSSVF